MSFLLAMIAVIGPLCLAWFLVVDTWSRAGATSNGSR